MDRVIKEMAKAKGDVERRLREYIPEIIRECMAFAYLGKTFTFDVSDLSDKVNARLIALSDAILDDIESRAKTAIQYAEEEEDEDAILLYIKRKIGEEDIVQRIDKHCSTLRYFLEGWIAIGMVNKLKEYELTNQILSYIDNPFASPLWQEAFNAGYLSTAIRSRGYSYGKGNQRNVLSALSEIERYAINEAYQYGRFLRYSKEGAIGYTIHRGSGFDCPYCDSFTGVVHPMTESLLPLHPRCVCWSKPVFGRILEDAGKTPKALLQNGGLTEAQKKYRKDLQKWAIDKYKGTIVKNVFNIQISSKGIKEFINQPHKQYFEKNELVRNLPQLIGNSEYVGIREYHKDNKYIKASHIYETFINEEKSYLIVRETVGGEHYFYSISDSMEIK